MIKHFGSMHQSVMTRIENSVSKYWIIKTTAEISIKSFEF